MRLGGGWDRSEPSVFGGVPRALERKVAPTLPLRLFLFWAWQPEWSPPLPTPLISLMAAQSLWAHWGQGHTQVQALSLPGGGPEKIQVLVDHVPGRGDKSRRLKDEVLAAGETEASQDAGEKEWGPQVREAEGGHSLGPLCLRPTCFPGPGVLPDCRAASPVLCLSPARPKFILLWLTPFPQGIFTVKPDGQTSTLDPASLNPSLCPAPFLVLVAGPAPGPYPSILVAAPASATMGLVCDRDLFPTPVASSLRA